MLKINPEMRKKLKTPWLWTVIVIAVAAVWAMIFYWAAQPPADKIFEVWISSEKPMMSTEKHMEIEKTCIDGGMKKCIIRDNMDPNDTYYAAAFGMQARSVDIYILHYEEAMIYAEEMKMFREIETDLPDDMVAESNGVKIGIKIKDDFYVFINDETEKDEKLIYEVIDILLTIGENNG